MTTRVEVVEAPKPVISLDEALEHLRADDSDDQALIEALVAAATGHIDGPDGWLGRAIGEQVLEAYVPAPALIGATVLPYQPIIDIVSVEARSDDGWDLLDPVFYELRGKYLAFKGAFRSAIDWRIGEAEAMRVRYRAGYEKLPPALKAAILLMVGDLYRNRETVTTSASAQAIPMSTSVANLLNPFRVWR